MTITLHETYRHLDGTPGQGSVSVRTVTPFHDAQGTVVGAWVTTPLAPDGSVSITIDADLEHADPGPQWLQVLESVDCARGGMWDIGPDVLFAAPNPTITLGLVRTMPQLIGDPPRYTPVPGATGPQGPTGPTGPKGDDGFPPPGGGSDGDVLQLTGSPGSPVWTGNLATALNRTDYLQDQLNDLLLSTPTAYSPTATYVDGDVVSFQGQIWVAKKNVAAGDSPTVAPGSWQSLALEDIATKARNAQNGLDEKVSKSGDTMSGNLLMGANQVQFNNWRTGEIGGSEYRIQEGGSVVLRMAPGSVSVIFNRQVVADPPTGANAVPRLARVPDPTTGDLGLPGDAGSDTGWRNVSTSLLNGWTGTLHVRRAASMVFLRGDVDGTNKTIVAMFHLPMGFRSDHFPGRAVHLTNQEPSNLSPTQDVIGLFSGSGEVVNCSAAGRALFSISFPAHLIQGWPTTLPGTPVAGSSPAVWS